MPELGEILNRTEIPGKAVSKFREYLSGCPNEPGSMKCSELQRDFFFCRMKSALAQKFQRVQANKTWFDGCGCPVALARPQETGFSQLIEFFPSILHVSIPMAQQAKRNSDRACQ